MNSFNNIKGLSGITLILLLMVANLGLAQTQTYTRSTGDITGTIYGTSTTGGGSAFPTLVTNHRIYIDDNITVTTNFQAWKNQPVTIYLNATMTFTGKLELHQDSQIIFQSSSAKVISNAGNSDKISFGTGQAQWDGSDPDLTGPGVLNRTSNGALPITLLSFTAKSFNNALILNWATSMELNFDQFLIERSENGKDFISIGQQKGNGSNSTHRIDYTFSDINPLVGKNYYRLKSVDLDGSFEYSPVVFVDFAGDKNINIYPNPSDGNSINVLANFESNEASVQVYDNLGVKINETTINELKSTIMFNSLKQGSYLLRYTSAEHNQVIRFNVK